MPELHMAQVEAAAAALANQREAHRWDYLSERSKEDYLEAARSALTAAFEIPD